MANNQIALDRVFHALGDPTRLAVINRLASGPASVSGLAAPFAMALPTFLRHLDVLETHGLISSKKVGRVRTCRLEPKTLSQVDAWLTDRRALWNRRLDQLGDVLGETSG